MMMIRSRIQGRRYWWWAPPVVVVPPPSSTTTTVGANRQSRSRSGYRSGYKTEAVPQPNKIPLVMEYVRGIIKLIVKKAGSVSVRRCHDILGHLAHRQGTDDDQNGGPWRWWERSERGQKMPVLPPSRMPAAPSTHTIIRRDQGTNPRGHKRIKGAGNVILTTATVAVVVAAETSAV
jgi:hypothetical protein